MTDELRRLDEELARRHGAYLHRWVFALRRVGRAGYPVDALDECGA